MSKRRKREAAAAAERLELIHAKDLRYRGPMSYRGLRFIALLALFVSHAALLYLVVSILLNSLAAGGYISMQEITFFKRLMLLEPVTFPLIMVSAFTSVLRMQENIKRLLLFNGIAALLFYIFLAFFGEAMIHSTVVAVPTVVLESTPLDKLFKVILPQALTRVREEYGSANITNVTAFITNMLKELNGTDYTAIAEKLAQFGSTGIIGGFLNSMDLSVPVRLLSGISAESLQPIADGITAMLPAIADTVTPYIVNHYLNANMFMDLFLCTLFYFFVSYRPKKLRESGLFLFRSCAILPALYIVISIMLTGQLRKGALSLPAWAVALLTSRPPAAIAMFFLMVLYMKFSEIRYRERGGSHEEYVEYLGSNRNSFSFSVFLCVMMVVVCAVDYGLSGFKSLSNWRIGTTYTMIFGLPFLLLFSYNRTPKHKALTGLVNVGIVLTYILFILAILGVILALPDMIETVIAGTAG